MNKYGVGEEEKEGNLDTQYIY